MAAALPIIIAGAGGHGRVVLDTCRAAGAAVAGFVDPSFAPGTLVNGATILGGDDYLTPGVLAAHAVIAGFADRAARRRLMARVRAGGGSLGRAVHPSSVVAPDALVGAGTVIVAGAIVNTGARIGDFCIVNTRAIVEHDCVLADGVQVAPNATLCGAVACDADAVIGAGAVVRECLRIGAGALVGAGAVVTRDVAAGITVGGNPARPLGN